MNGSVAGDGSPWSDATLAASLFAVDPIATSGIVVRALAGPVRDRWLAVVRELLPASTHVRRIPLNVPDSRLLGGLDLAATLRAGRPVAERGVLAELDGGVALLPMAERANPFTIARLTAVLDTGVVLLERDGFTKRYPSRFGVIALDEGIAEEERPSNALLDRLALHVDLSGGGIRDVVDAAYRADEIFAARARLPTVASVSDEIVEALCATAKALGIPSIRAPLLALRVARAAAALAGRREVSEDDATAAGRLVLAPRAITLPMEQPAERESGEAKPRAVGDQVPRDDNGTEESTAGHERSLDEMVLAATQAAIPAGVLARLRLGGADAARALSSGKTGALRHGQRRGRPAGIKKGDPRSGAHLNVIETLRAAAPWQPIRRRAVSAYRGVGSRPARVEVRRDDFRVTRFKQRAQTTSIFVVDASGSAALHRLAECKGAVELLLADCYVRRDRVALIAFRGSGAQLLLPPTRSLVRAKRSLAGLPGGGGTPLAAGIEAAVALSDAVRRRGETPVVILLTDGRANIARDGKADRSRAEQEALAAAGQVRAAGLTALLVDTSPRPRPSAERLAERMNATYLPLPYADAAVISRAVRAKSTPYQSGAPAR